MGWKTLKLCAQITQRGCNNRQEKVKGKTFFFFRKRPTWQRFCISDLPRACQHSSSGNIAKKHKNKLFAITAVPMGTGPQRVCPLRHSSAQTVCKPTPQHAAQPKRGGVGAAQTPPPPASFSKKPRPLTEPCYQCKRLVGPRLWKVPQGGKGSRFLRWWACSAHSHTSSP